MSTNKHLGSCHCGAVKFEVAWDASAGGSRCNCSVCTKLGVTGAIVKPEAFTLLAGEGETATYEWGGKTARRHFCRSCGAHCFAFGHLAELGGDYVSFNLNCIDGIEPSTLKIVYWDGRHDNWQAGPRVEPWPVLAAARA